jgi:hypothetical protein
MVIYIFIISIMLGRLTICACPCVHAIVCLCPVCMHVILVNSPELKATEREVEVVLKFPEAETLSPPILQINEVSFGYSSDRMIFSNVNLGATLESRICIVSSYLVKLLVFIDVQSYISLC